MNIINRIVNIHKSLYIKATANQTCIPSNIKGDSWTTLILSSPFNWAHSRGSGNSYQVQSIDHGLTHPTLLSFWFI